jgi:diguanylate cyclase (GGDEF)-like protein
MRTLTRPISLRIRIYLATFAFLLTISFSLLVSLYSQKWLAAHAHEILDMRITAMHAAQTAKEALVSHNNAIFRFLATQDERQLEASREFRQSAMVETDRLRILLNNQVIRERIQLLRKEMDGYFKDARQLLELSKSNELPQDAGVFQAAAWARMQGTQKKELSFLSAEGQERLMRAYALCEELITYNRAQLVQAQSEMDEALDESFRTALAIFAVSGGLILFISVGLALSLAGSFRSLLDGVRRVQAGNLDVEIPSSSSPELGELTNAFNNMIRTIRDQREKLVEESMTDELTGAHNQRHFRQLLKQQYELARRTNQMISLLMIDTDHFKKYNDTHGHEMGNEVLKRISHAIQDSLRDMDILARYGGDEFSVILPGASQEEAQAIAERLLESVSFCRLPGQDTLPNGHMTLSIGGATFPKDAHAVHDLLVKADEALYAAKEGGRGCVKWASELLAEAT